MDKVLLRLIGVVSICFGSGLLAETSSNFSVGATYINSNSIYAGVGSTSRFMPSIAYENDKVKVGLREGVS